MIWWDAADNSTITLSSTSNVAAWTNKANPTATLSQLTGSNQPVYASINNLSAVQFDGSRQCFLRTPTTLCGYNLVDPASGQNFTLFGVVNLSAPTTPCNVFGAYRGDNNMLMRWASLSSNQFWMIPGGTAGGGSLSMSLGQMVYNSTTVLTTRVSGSTGTDRTCVINGNVQTITASLTGTLGSTMASTYYAVLGDNTAGSNVSGYVHELLLYNDRLADSARQTIEDYLLWKWGGQSNVDNPVTLYRAPPQQTLKDYYSLIPRAPLWWFDAMDRSTISVNSNNALVSWNSRYSSVIPSTCTPSEARGFAPILSNFSNGLPAFSFLSTASQCMFMSNATSFSNSFLTQIFVMELATNAGSSEEFMNNQGSNTAAFRVFRRTPTALQVLIQPPRPADPAFTVSSSYLNVPIVVSVTETNGDATNYPSEDFNLYVNGNLTIFSPTSATGKVSTLSSLFFGGQFVPFVSTGSATQYATCRLGEWMGFSPPLIRNQREIVEGYLAAKWGITLSSGNALNGTSFGLTPATTVSPHPYYRRTGTLSLPMLAPSLYSPNSFSNLILWLDAADRNTVTLSTNGMNVVQWIDKSICGNHMTLSPGTLNTNRYFERQLGGLPIIRGVSGTSLSNALTSNLGSMTFMINRYVASQLLDSGTSTFTSAATTSNRIVIRTARTGNSGSFVAGLSGGATYTFSNSNLPTIHAIVNVSTTVSYYVNGSLIGNTVSSNWSGTAGPFAFGNLTSAYDMGEVVVYRYVNPNIPLYWMQTQIEGYLAWKWNLRNYLPSNHPYYLKAP